MQNIFRIIKLAKPLYATVGIIAFLIVVTSTVDLINPIVSKFIVDEIVAQVQLGTGNGQTLATLIAISFGLSILAIILTAVSERLGDHFAGKLRQFLTEKFYHKVLTLPQSYFDSAVSGKIVNQLSRGITSIQGFINTATNFILPTFLQSILTIGILAYYNLGIAIFVLILFPIYLVISYYSSKRWGKREGVKNQIEDLTRGRIQEVISNIKLVKGFTNEKREYELVSGNLQEINNIYAKQSQEFHIFDFVRNLSLNIILLGINILLFYNTFTGQLTIGELVLIIQLINQVRRPLFAMSFILEAIQQAEAGSKEFLEVLALKSTEEYSNATSEKISAARIDFKNVSFQYETGNPVINDVSFSIKGPEMVALVGPSGAGKTTIINLILKFYQPTGGQILLNGKEFGTLDHSFIRQNISLVFQENELFSSTVRENVAYGMPEASDESIIEALKKANAWDFVSRLPEGLNATIGERGVKLSGGQKQRIQIARAILKNAPILILDEATSSLDAKSELEVQSALDNLFQDKLVLVIAHRFSTIQNASKIIVVNDHKIESIGTPQELAKTPGIYSDLLKYQIEGNEKLLQKFELSI